MELYKQYQQLAEQTPGVWFVGRLATYKYYNMDQVTAQALTVYKKMSRANGRALDLGKVTRAGSDELVQSDQAHR
jgi:UDP-galactopyranose mutase